MNGRCKPTTTLKTGKTTNLSVRVFDYKFDHKNRSENFSPSRFLLPSSPFFLVIFKVARTKKTAGFVLFEVFSPSRFCSHVDRKRPGEKFPGRFSWSDLWSNACTERSIDFSVFSAVDEPARESVVLSVVRVVNFAQKTTGHFIGRSRGRTTY